MTRRAHRSLKARVGRHVPGIRAVMAERDALQRAYDRLVFETEQERQAHERRTGDSLGYLFIMTYGRSGSTLLQGILNSIPGYLIRGENRSMLYQLHRYHSISVKERGRLARSEVLPTTHPFFGADGYPDAVAFRDMRQLALDTLLRPEEDTRVTGFKEIRWNQKDLEAYVEFLGEVFPDARFIVNTRSHASVAQSKWWRNRPDALRDLEAQEKRMVQLGLQLGEASFHVHYDDYVDDPTKLGALFDWLGEPFDEARVRDTMSQRHSY